MKPIVTVFRGISRGRFQAIRARINAQAEQMMNGDDIGSASGEGFEVTWTYNEHGQVLAMTCLKKPWFVKARTVLRKMRDLVEVDL